MATKKQKAKVGFFLMICFGLIIGGGVVLSGLSQKPGIGYWMEFEDSILGIGEGGLVEYKGVPVGRVTSIYVQENNNARVDISIDPSKVKLEEGVVAQLALYSFAAGTMAVSLTGGNGAELPPGSQIPAKSSAFATISSQISDVMSQLNEIFAKIDKGLEGIEEGKLASIVNHVDEIMADGKGFVNDTRDLINESKQSVAELRESAKTAVDEFKGLSQDIRGITTDVKKLIGATTSKVEGLNVDETQANLNKVLENIGTLTDKLNETATQVDSLTANAMHDADNVEYTLRETAKEVQEALSSMRSLADELQRDPSQFLRGKAKIEDNLP